MRTSRALHDAKPLRLQPQKQMHTTEATRHTGEAAEKRKQGQRQKKRAGREDARHERSREGGEEGGGAVTNRGSRTGEKTHPKKKTGRGKNEKATKKNQDSA